MTILQIQKKLENMEKRLERIEIGNFVARDIKISINQADMDTSLLGMSLLKYFNSIEIRKQKLILKY